jgi:hypothetical protein
VIRCLESNSQYFVFLSLMSGSDKLKCYVTLSWKGLRGTNTLAYFAQLKIAKDNKSVVNATPGGMPSILYFLRNL